MRKSSCHSFWTKCVILGECGNHRSSQQELAYITWNLMPLISNLLNANSMDIILFPTLLFPEHLFTTCLSLRWVGNDVVTLLCQLPHLCQVPVCECCSISLEAGNLFLLQNFYLLVFVCVLPFFFPANTMRQLILSNVVEKGKGGKRRSNHSFGVGSFCSKLILLLIGFANWRSWINRGIIWNWFCFRSSALCALIFFCVLLDCATTL